MSLATGVLPERLGGCVLPASKTPTSFLTKMIFPTLLMTWPKIRYPADLFQACLIISYLVQTHVKDIVKGFCWSYNFISYVFQQAP